MSSVIVNQFPLQPFSENVKTDGFVQSRNLMDHHLFSFVALRNVYFLAISRSLRVQYPFPLTDWGHRGQVKSSGRVCLVIAYYNCLALP